MDYDKVDFSDIYDPDTLLEEAKKYLQTCINLAITIELTAVDLHMIDVDINSIRLGDLVPCISTQHGIMSMFGDVSTYYLVSKYELDLENPTNNKITLGRTISTLTDKQVNDSVNLKAQISEVRTEMYNLPGLSLEPITNEDFRGNLKLKEKTMADNNYLDQNGVLYLWQKIVAKITNMIANKVDKVDGKGLSTNDYTTAVKNKACRNRGGGE